VASSPAAPGDGAALSGGERISLDRTKITTDLNDLEALLAEAKAAAMPAAERRLLERSLRLLRGEPLAGWDHVWAETDTHACAPSRPNSSNASATPTSQPAIRTALGWRQDQRRWREGARVPPHEEWLIAEWPDGHDEPDRLLDLQPPSRHRARAARSLALEDGARLQAAQRRVRPGPLRRLLMASLVSPHALVSAAHGFLTLERLNPFAGGRLRLGLDERPLIWRLLEERIVAAITSRKAGT
jgi:hypothetical protein